VHTDSLCALVLKLGTARGNGPKVGRHLKRPVLVHEDLDDVEQDKVQEREDKHGDRPWPSDARVEAASQEAVNSDKDLEDLGGADDEEKDDRGPVLPEEALQTGAKDEKVGARACLEENDVLDLPVCEAIDVL